MAGEIPLDQPIGIQSLPVELIQVITSLLSPKDRTRLLLSSPYLVDALEPLVYEELYLSDTEVERNSLLVKKLSSRADLASVTRTLNIELHGYDITRAEICTKSVMEAVTGGLDASDEIRGSCGCCHIEWKDGLLPQVVTRLPGVKAVHFTIHRASWTFHEDFYRIFHATCRFDLFSLSIYTPNIDTNTARHGWCDPFSLLKAQPSLRNLVLMCHVSISPTPGLFSDSELPLLESFTGFFNCWKVVRGRPVSRVRLLCRLAGGRIPNWAPSCIFRRMATSSTGPIREMTLVFADDEIEWEKEPFVVAILRKVPTLQRLSVETSRGTVEVPIQTMDIPGFLASLDPNDYPL